MLWRANGACFVAAYARVLHSCTPGHFWVMGSYTQHVRRKMKFLFPIFSAVYEAIFNKLNGEVNWWSGARMGRVL